MEMLLKKERNTGLIEGFVTTQILDKGLDQRTEKAYRLDLEHLYLWLENKGRDISESQAIDDYLEYLLKEKELKYSTITRKYRVFRYYLGYLEASGILTYHPIICPILERTGNNSRSNELSRMEIDEFFMALDKEYETLDNEFRKRICLRDNVMMKLLFYHEIDISELLKLKVSDYNLKTGILAIRGKRGKEHFEYLFSRELRQKMEQWIEEHSYFEKGNEFHNMLFLSKIGKPLSMKMVILVFDKYRVLAGIEKEFTPKDLKGSMKRYARELMVERCS